MHCHLFHCCIHIRAQMLSVERLVFDVFGQMWGTMLLNTMSALCTVTGVLGVCISEKTAIGVVSSSSTVEPH